MNFEYEKFQEDGNAEKAISLKNGEKAEFYKIPYGTEYQITEGKNKYAPSYRIDAATVKKTTDKASADTDLSTETGKTALMCYMTFSTLVIVTTLQ